MVSSSTGTARPLSCVVVRKQMPEKEVSKEKFPFFKLFSGVPGESDPAGQLCGIVPPPEKPLCSLTTARRGSELPGRSQKTGPAEMAGNLHGTSLITTVVLIQTTLVKAPAVLLML